MNTTAQSVTHTPGPWQINWSIGDYHRITGNDDPTMGYIANVPDHAPTDGDMEAEAKANARLIAAAPDMLKVLYATEATLLGSSHDILLARVKAAIAKATP